MNSTQLKKRLLGASVLAIIVASAGFVYAQQVNVVKTRVTNKDYHTVQDGDTLYDLSGRFMSDVYQWPKLWSYNPHITNPHWIYPGDIVYLRDGGVPSPSGPQIVRSNPTQRTELHVAVGGFIEPEQLKYVGRIVASPKQAVMLADMDTVWVGFGDGAYTAKEREDLKDDERVPMKSSDKEVQVGDRFAIVRQVDTLTDEDNEDNVLGHKYVVLGSLTVKELSKKYLHTAEIDQSWYDMKRGDLLIPYEQQLKQVQIIQSEQDMVAKIVDTLEPRIHLGEMHYVYINKGAKDNVRTGNRFYVFQKREGLDFLDEKPAEEIPWDRIGQVLLIDVREDYSMGIVIDSKREILMGDRLEMYQGY